MYIEIENDIYTIKEINNIIEKKDINQDIEFNLNFENKFDINNILEEIGLLGIEKTKSDIFNSFKEIKFIIERLKKDEKFKNKNIQLNLIFKATKDGENSSDFHKKCDGMAQQLVFIKTKKGKIFGGYTEIGFKSQNSYIVDNKAFIFCFSTNKIILKKENMPFMIIKIMDLLFMELPALQFI